MNKFIKFIRLIPVPLYILLFSCSLFAQKQITLEAALETAFQKSYTILSSELALKNSQRNLEAVEMGLRTSVEMEFDVPRYSNSLKSQFNPETGSEQFYEVGNTTVETRLFFTQPLIFSNGTFSLVGSLFGRDQFSGTSPLTRDYYSNLSFRLRQPLFGFNNLKANLERAKINLKKSERNYQRAKSEMVYNVSAAFYNLYQAKRQLEIAEETVSQNALSFSTAENKFKAGLIAEVEKLQLEVDLASAQNDQLSAENTYSELKDNFKLLIGLPLEEDIEPSGEISFTSVNIDSELAITAALNNRPEIKNAEADILLSEFSLDEISSRGSITGLLTANYGINKNDNEVYKIFRNPAEDRGVVFTLSLPIWDWNKNDLETEAAFANYELAKLNAVNQELTIRKEITGILNKITAAKSRVEVLSKSVDVAQKGFDISVERFKNGNITSFDLSQQQLRLTNTKLNSLRALIDYKLTLADLNRRTLHDFEK